MKVTIMMGNPQGPVLIVERSLGVTVDNGSFDIVQTGHMQEPIQLLHTSVLSQQPAECIEVLRAIGRGVHTAQEVLDAIIQVHNRSLPPPEIDITSFQTLISPFALSEREPGPVDKIPSPKGYKRNRFQR